MNKEKCSSNEVYRNKCTPTQFTEFSPVLLKESPITTSTSKAKTFCRRSTDLLLFLLFLLLFSYLLFLLSLLFHFLFATKWHQSPVRNCIDAAFKLQAHKICSSLVPQNAKIRSYLLKGTEYTVLSTLYNEKYLNKYNVALHCGQTPPHTHVST